MSEYRIENDRLRLTVDSLGAEMRSVFDLRDGIEYLWQGDPKYWSGRAPVLFPIVGRVKEGVYRHDGKTYKIDSPHGFAQRSRFEPEFRQSDRIQFVLRSSDETRKQYPFDFIFRVEYALIRSALRIRYLVENAGTEPMPYSSGGHPGFRVPLGKDDRFEDYRLEFEGEETPERILLDGVFISGKQAPFPLKGGRIIPLERRLFDDEAVILDKIRKKTIALIGPRDRKYWSFSFDDFRYLGIWQPQHSDAPLVSLEPWNGLPDPASPGISDLERKTGIRIVQPCSGDEVSFRLDFS